MIEVESKLKRWGRSFGVIIPMEAVKEQNLKEDEQIKITITKKKNPFIEAFGSLKRPKITTEKLLKEIDKEGWDE
ncbi:MAG TPA: hypothetical protein VJK51_02540 [Candidatus Nanoarchaeia archaeon]|nr:hypothetical protein [Candidatus Nanoarchaeia archaeon]